MNTELKHDIYIDWELAGTNPYKPLLTRVITAALAAENVTIPCSVDVLLMDGLASGREAQQAPDDFRSLVHRLLFAADLHLAIPAHHPHA